MLQADSGIRNRVVWLWDGGQFSPHVTDWPWPPHRRSTSPTPVTPGGPTLPNEFPLCRCVSWLLPAWAQGTDFLGRLLRRSGQTQEETELCGPREEATFSFTCLLDATFLGKALTSDLQILVYLGLKNPAGLMLMSPWHTAPPQRFSGTQCIAADLGVSWDFWWVDSDTALEATNIFFSLKLMFLSLSSSFLTPLRINKIKRKDFWNAQET